MGLIPAPTDLLSRGVVQLFRGLRTGDQRALLTGAAIAAFGLWRRSSAPKKELLHREVVKEGSSLVIRSGADQRRVEVRRVDG